MENEKFIGSTIIIGAVIGGFVLLIAYIVRLFKADTKQNERSLAGKASEQQQQQQLRQKQKKEHQHQQGHAASGTASSVKNKKKTADSRWIGRSDKQTFAHPWLLTSLKGHTGQVLDMDFSSNGKYLASCAEDRTVLLWDAKDLTQKEHRSLRINVEFDYATFVKWSPDSKAFIINKFNDNALEVYKVEKKKDGWLGPASKAVTFPKAHKDDVISMAIASTGKFIMTCSNKTDMVVWDLKGQQLALVDTYLMATYCAKITPCGRFIVASGFAPDVKVWEVVFNKAGEFQEVRRAFELSGHSSGVYDVAFDADTSHMATVSKDGTWKIFDTKVEYRKGEDPHLIITGKYEHASNPSRIALSPDAEVVAITTFDSLSLYSASTGQLDYTIESIYTGPITSLLFDSAGKYVLTTGDRHIRVFHNVTGYRCQIASAKEKLKQNQTSATKERLQKIISDNETFLNNIEKKTANK